MNRRDIVTRLGACRALLHTFEEGLRKPPAEVPLDLLTKAADIIANIRRDLWDPVARAQHQFDEAQAKLAEEAAAKGGKRRPIRIVLEETRVDQHDLLQPGDRVEVGAPAGNRSFLIAYRYKRKSEVVWRRLGPHAAVAIHALEPLPIVCSEVGHGIDKDPLAQERKKGR